MEQLVHLTSRLNEKGSPPAILAAVGAAVALFAGMLLAANTGGAATPATIPLLTMGTTFLPSNLNPANRPDNNALYFGLETLTKLAADGKKIEPSLAVSWKRLNLFQWRFQLRKGVKFWDGSEMTAADVADSLNYARFPGHISAGAAYVTIRDVRPVGRYAVDVILKRRDVTVPFTLASTGAIFQKAYHDAHKTTYGRPGPNLEVMGTGPWIPRSFTPGVGEELDVHPNYWGGRPHIQHITIKFFADETSMALALRAGQIDAAFPGGAAAWESASGIKPVVDPIGSLYYFFASNVKMGPFSDVHVRRAVAYAINSKEVVQAFGSSYATTLPTFIPPSSLETVGTKAEVQKLLKSLPQYPYSVAKAKAEMAKSAYPNGFTTTTAIYNGFSLPIVMQVIQSQLKQIGITWNFQTYASSAQWQAYIYQREKNESVFRYSTLSSPDVSNVAQGSVGTYDPKKRLPIYGQILKRMAEDLPYIPVFLAHRIIGLNPKYTFTRPAVIHDYVHQQWPLYVVPKGG